MLGKHLLVIRSVVRGLVAVILALSLLTSGVPAANAVGGKPVVVERWDDRFTEEPEVFVLDECGVEVRTSFHFKGSFTLYADGTARIHENVEIVSSEPGSGDTLLIERNTVNRTSAPPKELIDEDAGTVTLMFDDLFVGLPLRWLIPGQGTLIRDAGTVRFITTVVLDLDTGQEIAFEQETTGVRGPHPYSELTDSEATNLLCDVLGDGLES